MMVCGTTLLDVPAVQAQVVMHEPAVFVAVHFTLAMPMDDGPDTRSPFASAFTDHGSVLELPLTTTFTCTVAFVAIAGVVLGLASGKLMVVGVTVSASVIAACAGAAPAQAQATTIARRADVRARSATADARRQRRTPRAVSEETTSAVNLISRYGAVSV